MIESICKVERGSSSRVERCKYKDEIKGSLQRSRREEVWPDRRQGPPGKGRRGKRSENEGAEAVGVGG